MEYLRSMPIRNRDGSPYVLSGPNPVMRGQSLWGKKATLRNCSWQYRVLGEEARPKPQPQERVEQSAKPDPGVGFYGELLGPMDLPPPVPVVNSLNDDGILADLPKVAIHCHPVIK